MIAGIESIPKKGCHYHDRLEKESKDNIHISWAEFSSKILP